MNARTALRQLSLSDEEQEAVRLYYDDGQDLRTISALTGLSTKTIRAATDRVAAVMTGQTGEAAEPSAPAAQPVVSPAARPVMSPVVQPGWTPPRRRIVRAVALPLAHTAPRPVLPEPELPNVVPAAVTVPTVPAPRRPRSVSKPAPKPRPSPEPEAAQAPAPVDDGPGSPAWAALAKSPTVRAWAAADGWQVPGPGVSLPGAIVRAYRKAHPTGGVK